MKQTKKYTAAVQCLSKLSTSKPAPRTVTASSEKLYEYLAGQGYAWNNKTGLWEKTQRPVDASGREQVSIFTKPDGSPTGIFRLRIMGHPDTLKLIEERIAEIFTLIEPGSKPYPNHKGPGSRVYCTFAMNTKEAWNRWKKREKFGREDDATEDDEEKDESF